MRTIRGFRAEQRPRLRFTLVVFADEGELKPLPTQCFGRSKTQCELGVLGHHLW